MFVIHRVPPASPGSGRKSPAASSGCAATTSTPATPELLDAVLAAAGHEDIGGDVGLSDVVLTVPAGSDSP
jgi:hypothetical protein